jgi:ribosomal protein S18 acetylase RimI-like enzyme
VITYKEFISEKDIQMLLSECKNGITNFRYFKNRPLNSVKQHKYNVMCYCDSIPASYGHLDQDKEFKLWLGILVSDFHQGKGLGKTTMEFLLDSFKKMNDKKLYLSVDEDNLKAISLYKKFGFNFLEKKENILYYVLEKD